MHWNQISFEINKHQADQVSEILMGLGSISISYSDSQDNAIFEPPVGETPLWESIQVKALFQSEVDINLVANILSKGCNIKTCLLYTSPSPRDRTRSRMPSSA